MNTYKKTAAVMFVTANVVISMVAGSLCRGTNTDYEAKITKLTESVNMYKSFNQRHIVTEALYLKEIDDLERDLALAQTELDEYKHQEEEAFQYAVATAPLYDLPLKNELQQYTYAMCSLYDIEDKYELVLALMWQESNYNAKEVSSTNDYGLMQINKCNHKFLRDAVGVDDFLDPHDNIQAGVYILSNLFAEYTTNAQVLMAYNMGPTGAKTLWDRGIYSSNYSRSVISKLNSIDKYYK